MSTSLQGRQPESAVPSLERNSPLERRAYKTPSQPESRVPARTVLLHDASPSTSVGATELPHRLQASKPVSWRGRGDLCQVPWTTPPRGTWLCFGFVGWLFRPLCGVAPTGHALLRSSR